MITLPSGLRLIEADYMCMILDSLDVGYKDIRLISLTCPETKVMVKEVITPHIPALNALYKVLGDDAFFALMTRVVEYVSENYGLGYKWIDDNRVNLNFTEIFKDALESVLKG